MAPTKKPTQEKKLTTEEKEARSKKSGIGHKRLEKEVDITTDAVNDLFAIKIEKKRGGRRYTQQVLEKMAYLISETDEGKVFAQKLKERTDDAGFEQNSEEFAKKLRDAAKLKEDADEAEAVEEATEEVAEEDHEMGLLD